MTWQRRAVGVLMLIALTLVPATAAMCAIACHDDTRAVTHCHEDADSSSRFQVAAAPAHDCGNHEAVVAGIATLPQLRVALPAMTSALDRLLLSAAPGTRRPAALTFASSAPPGSDPPTTIPSVLRV